MSYEVLFWSVVAAFVLALVKTFNLARLWLVLPTIIKLSACRVVVKLYDWWCLANIWWIKITGVFVDMRYAFILHCPRLYNAYWRFKNRRILKLIEREKRCGGRSSARA